jgi:ABC-type polysaccharide/polyol phosphate transport system ATPase subunit
VGEGLGVRGITKMGCSRLAITKRLYAHNFRYLENFELPLKGMPCALSIGKNGAGKSTIASVLEILQSIDRGINRVGQLVQPKDFDRGRSDVPVRFEIEVLLEESTTKKRYAV